ncbi:MAG: acetyl-CoA carboxylase, carboxyltransferase subunit beta [Candidatus Krumholzibacteria bacterium]|nr:acetyl-CoA carboxylase, carboxyltransferase subunit beta [Candidatus Krumholzibacteria bacterium]
MSWLTQAAKGIKALASQKKDIPDNLWRKCPQCSEILYHRELDRNLWVCGSCGHHLPFTTEQYIRLLFDEGTWQETHQGLTSIDSLDFKDSKRYKDRIKATQQKSGKEDAVITGRAKIGRIPVGVSIMEFSYMGGSMGSVVGEKISRALLDSLKHREAAIILSRSGGARMQESLLSLMQMAKTSAVLARLRKEGIPFISLLTNPTYGGVTASYATLGDINVAEPGALIGFAGPRVIKQTIGGDLPEGFQSSEFLLDHGMVDLISERKVLKENLEKTLHWFVDGRDISVLRPPRG